MAVLAAVPGISCWNASGPDSPPAQKYNHIRPRWSPDGATIVFRGDVGGRRGITLVDTSGLRPRLIHEGEGVGFAWSPDGKWICFAAYGSLQWISVTGDSLVQVTAGASDKRPAWSPDGGTIAFVRTGIWILGVTNGQATRLSGEGDYPSWHPNGREVVSLVACGSTDPYDLRTLYEMQAVDIRTGAWRRVWSVRSTATVEFATMSPAGDAVAFSAVPTGGIAQVWKVSLTDSTVVRLTDDGGDFPSWSPDGTMLVYTRNAADDGGIWMMRADGSGKRRLTSP